MLNPLFEQPTPARTIRPHQSRALDLIRQSFGQGNRRIVLQAPTGFGKSFVSSKLICGALAKENRAWFTVPRLSLIDQIITEFEREGISHIGVMQGQHPRTDASAPVQVVSVDTLARREIPSRAPSVVLVDECHLRSEAVERLMALWTDTLFIGLSATPWAVGMGKTWQDLQIAATLSELIAAGFLSKFRVLAPSDPDLNSVKVRRGDYVTGDLEKEMSKPALVGEVVPTWLARGENRPTLLFGVTCAHAQILQEEFLRAGIGAGYCDAHTDMIARKHLERQFRAGEVKVVCSVRTLTTGIDWPVSCIIDAAPTKSEMLHVQKIGRGLRINPGTEDCLILDHAGNTHRLGLVTDIHHDSLDDGDAKTGKREPTKKKQPRACSKCETVFSGLICPECGHERQPIPGIENVHGELIEVGSKGKPAKAKPATQAVKQRFWSMALALDDKRQKSGKLAKGLYKGRFGCWPRGLSDIRREPDQSFMNYEKASRIRYAKRKQA